MNIIKSSISKIKYFNKKSSKNINFKNIAIAGNPNVGKSTVFNALTGMKQHTGNWPGKTVECAQGKYCYNGNTFKITDIPGTYSLMSNSPEEEIARDFICFSNLDAIIVVMDATCLERNLNLALQILEMTKNVVICVNLIDEAKKKKIYIDLDELSLQLGVPVVYTNARKKQGIKKLMQAVNDVALKKCKVFGTTTSYPEPLNSCLENVSTAISPFISKNTNSGWHALKILENDKKLEKKIKNKFNEIYINPSVKKIIESEKDVLNKKNITQESIKKIIVKSLINKSEQISRLCVHIENKSYDKKDRKIDHILTSKTTGIPIMILLLMGIFWITISGANYPSEIIASALFNIQEKLTSILVSHSCPQWINGLFVEGMYRTLAWVVSVMLPPMAIFFPLFTFLEDVGYLPRIAFSLDNSFNKCGAHGKQALTTCMGFGCNACGVIGCRIIDSPRERLIALLTNNFVPCNGRLAQFNIAKK